MKLRLKFILSLVLLLVILIASLIYYLNFYFKDYFKSHALDDFQILAKLSESSYLSFVRGLEIRTIDWSSDGYIRSAVGEILKTPSSEREPLVKELNGYLRDEKVIYDQDALIIDILDKDGVVMASSRDDRLGVDEKKEELESGKIKFTEAIQANFGKTFVMPVVAEEDEHASPMIHITTRIFAAQKDQAGILVSLDAVMLAHFVNTDKLRDVLAGFHPGEDRPISEAFGEHYKTADVYLVNKDRLMITSSRFGDETILRQKVDTELVRACFERDEEIKTEYFDYRGQPVFGASVCMKKDGLVLVFEAESHEILAPLRDVNRFLIIAGGIIIILAIISIILLSDWLLSGLGVITNVVENIIKGDTKNRVKINSKDEIGYLAKVFNDLLDNARRKDKFMSLIKDIVIDINEARGINNAYQAIIEKICVYGDWPIGHVYLRDENSDVLISTQIWHLSDPEKFKIFKEVTEKTNFEKGVGLPGRVLESKSPIWIPDVAKDANFPRAKLIKNINVGAAFGFPVVSEDNKIIAIFEFFSAEPKEIESGFFEVIKNINSQINGVVEKIKSKEQLEKKVKERTEELMKLKVELEKMVSRKTVDLEKKLDELEKFKKLTIDRELKMIELKKKIAELGGDKEVEGGAVKTSL